MTLGALPMAGQRAKARLCDFNSGVLVPSLRRCAVRTGPRTRVHEVASQPALQPWRLRSAGGGAPGPNATGFDAPGSCVLSLPSQRPGGVLDKGFVYCFLVPQAVPAVL